MSRFRFCLWEWQAERIGEQFILGPGPPAEAPEPADGKRRLIWERGWSPGSVMTTDPSSLQEGHSRTGGPVSCGDCPVVRDSEYSD